MRAALRVLGLGLALCLASAAARAESLTVALTNDEIAIGSNFSGTRLSLFGVIERDENSVPRPGAYEVIVVVRGPEHQVLVQQRERKFGIWVNDAGEVFDRMPTYYGLFATPGARALIEASDGVARRLSLAMLGADDGSREAHRAAIAESSREDGLYVEELEGIEKLSKTFFRTEIPLPPLVADGEFRVFVFLYAGDTAIATKELGFMVHKTGFEQRIYEWSRQSSLLYGLGAVVLALVTGYVGGVVFRRG